MNMTPQEEGRYRVLLIQVGKNTEEEKDAFCKGISTRYGVAVPLLRKIVDSSPIVLKKNLSLRRAEILADIVTSFGATVSIEKRWNDPLVSVEFREIVPPCVALEICSLRKTTWGTWNVLGRMKNTTGEDLNDVWVLVQVFGDADEFLAIEEVPVLINPLPPGENAPFKAVFEGSLQVKRISLVFKDACGKPLPAKDLLTRQEWVSVATSLPSGRDDLRDSDLDVPVLEIHGKPDPREIEKKGAGAFHPLPPSEELYLEIESDLSHRDSLTVTGEEEDMGEEEVARLTGEFLSLSSSAVASDQEMDLFLLKESLESQDSEPPAPEAAAGFTAQKVAKEEVLDKTSIQSEEPETISLPSLVSEERSAEEESLVPGVPEAIEQPNEAQFQSDETPFLPSDREGHSASMPLQGIETGEPSLKKIWNGEEAALSSVAPNDKEWSGHVLESEKESMDDVSRVMKIPVLSESLQEEAAATSKEVTAEALKQEESPPFPWIEEFRKAIGAYYQGIQDSFSIWFGEQEGKGGFEDSFHRVLAILIHARFDQMSPPEKALENTEKVFPLVPKPDLVLDEIPPLEGTQFSSGEKWRILFCRAIPRLREVSGQVTTRNVWDAFELERLIQVIPHMSEKGSRRAVLWIHKLMAEVIQIDFSKTFIAIGKNLYRVVCRLGVVDPHFDHFRGRNSPGDLKIQSFARSAFPSHPGGIEEPLDRVGMEEEKGGNCFSTRPKCDGCLFDNFCSKLYIDFNPSEKGMLP